VFLLLARQVAASWARDRRDGDKLLALMQAEVRERRRQQVWSHSCQAGSTYLLRSSELDRWFSNPGLVLQDLELELELQDQHHLEELRFGEVRGPA
jgi:hypothetical protein